MDNGSMDRPMSADGCEVTHVDCFAGPGGITTGFKAAGIKTIAAIEKVQSCVDTFRANHPSVEIISKDIRRVKKEDLYGKGIKKANIVTAGMPCETFSTAGSKSRSFYDYRQMLFCEGIRIAKIVDADFILLENVPAITSKKVSKSDDRLIVDLIYQKLSDTGYKWFIDTILDSSDFGIPQKRKRFFILASKKNLQLLAPVSKRNGIMTVKDAFIDLPSVSANGRESKQYLEKESTYSLLMRDAAFWKSENVEKGLTYHVPPNHRPVTLERFKLIKQGEGLKDLFDKLSAEKVAKLQKQRVLPKRWYIQRNRRLVPTQLSPTVTSHCLDELIHPTQNRCLTVREVARLQSFPDSYNFAGGPFICPHIYETQDKYEQVGDAVPPLLAYHWGLKLKCLIQG
jgi:DNA (cytosine-5)-methyltransferase 1